jgi:hypothetical protein
LNPVQAEILALKALTFLTHSPETLSGFVSATGIQPADLRARAGDPEILAAVMDFMLADDARVTAFCQELAIGPREVQAARRALPGA